MVDRGCGRLVLSGSLVVNVTLKAAGGTSDLLDQDTLLGSAADFRHGLTPGLLAHFAHEVFNCNVDKERSTRESSMLPQPKVMPAWELGVGVVMCCSVLFQCPLFCRAVAVHSGTASPEVTTIASEEGLPGAGSDLLWASSEREFQGFSGFLNLSSLALK